MFRKAILTLATIVILGALVLNMTSGQTPSLVQDQIAIRIVSERFKIPADQLAVVYKLSLVEERIIRIKVFHVPAKKTYMVNLDMHNLEYASP
jgi:hypothetical protein